MIVLGSTPIHHLMIMARAMWKLAAVDAG